MEDCERLPNFAREIRATVEYLWGCYWICAPYMPSIGAELEILEKLFGKQMRQNWRRRAWFANSVVGSLMPKWRRAPLLFDLFAGLLLLLICMVVKANPSQPVLLGFVRYVTLRSID
jgi:hypothetical protein